MSEHWPPCPSNTPDECVLSQSGQTTTTMGYTPQYKRDGTRVGADPNWKSWTVRCSACGRQWWAKKKGDAPTEWTGGKLPGEA